MFTYAVARDPAVAGYAMVSDRFLALLSPAADEEVAALLWRTLTAGPGALSSPGQRRRSTADAEPPTLESVLSALAAHGIPNLPDFALVELVDAPTRTVALAVRGAASIALAGGDVRTGEGAGSWHESSAQEVRGLTLRVGGEAPPALSDLPIGRGIVRASRLDWGVGAVGRAAPVTTASAVDDDDADGPEISPPADANPPATSLADAASEPPLATVRREDLLPRADPIDDRTELSRVHRRRGAGRPVLRLGEDRLLDLDLPLVLGRAPKPAAHPGARLVSLPSPQREISGTHLEVRLEGDVLVARDLGSTNGTIVCDIDGSTQLLRHGAAARLSRGASLDLGDGAIAIFDVADGAGT